MLVKTIRINLLLTLALVLSACAHNQAVDQSIDSNLQAASKQASQTDEAANAEVDKMMEEHGLPPIFREVLTTEQLLELSTEEPNLDLTDEQVKKLKEAGVLFDHDDDELTEEKMAAMSEMMAPNLIKAGTDAPDFELTDNHGNKRKLSDFRGKYVLIDFWGTWCAPCVEALPKLAKAYEQMDKSKVEFVGVCTASDNFAEFVKKEKLSWVQLNDPEGSVSKDYGVDGYPTLLLIGPDGKVIQGGMGGGSEKHLLATIKKHTK